MWGIPEKEANLLPERVDGLDVIELGCGAAYVSAWLARRGARVTGIDNSEEQLKTARALELEHGLAFPLIHGSAERVPLPGASSDLAISEYGASIWCDPYRWIPEAARLMRPNGLLVFLVNGTLLVLRANEDQNVPATPFSCETTLGCIGSNSQMEEVRWNFTWAMATGSVSLAGTVSRSRI